MEYIKIMWQSGKQTVMEPHVLSEGASRDVLWGTDLATKKVASVVVKLQGWQWHGTSNGHEFRLVSQTQS